MTDLRFAWLEITGKCRLSCTHYYADSGPRGTEGTMSSRDWLRVVDHVAELGAHSVQFIGGEPTLHPDLSEFVDRALGAGLTVEVFSNLVHIGPRLWDTFSRPSTTPPLAAAAATPAPGPTSPRRCTATSRCAPASSTSALPTASAANEPTPPATNSSPSASLTSAQTTCVAPAAAQTFPPTSSAVVAATALWRSPRPARSGPACSPAGSRWATYWIRILPRSCRPRRPSPQCLLAGPAGLKAAARAPRTTHPLLRGRLHSFPAITFAHSIASYRAVSTSTS